MPKTSNVFARVEPELKEEAEAVLNQIGLPMSNAIALFLRQVVLKRGVPFPLILPPVNPPAVDALTVEELDAELEKGYVAMLEGRCRPAEEVFAELDKEFGI